MSRLGKQPVKIPSGVAVEVSGDTVSVKGPKGEDTWNCHPAVQVSVEDDVVKFSRRTEEKIARSMHGTARQLVQNMIVGVTEGFSKTLDIIGVGYNAKMQGKKLVLSIGFCHPVAIDVPDGVECECPKESINRWSVSSSPRCARSVLLSPIRARGSGIATKWSVASRRRASAHRPQET